MIYERKRGIKYVVENAYSRPDGMGGRDVKPGLLANFKPVSDVNQMGIFDSRKTAEAYVQMEISTGRCKPEDRQKRVAQVDKRLCEFVENHIDYTREGGLDLIRRQKTKEERAEELKRHAQALIDQANELEGNADKMTEEEMEQAVPPTQKKDEMVKPVEVISGPVTSGSQRGR